MSGNVRTAVVVLKQNLSGSEIRGVMFSLQY